MDSRIKAEEQLGPLTDLEIEYLRQLWLHVGTHTNRSLIWRALYELQSLRATRPVETPLSPNDSTPHIQCGNGQCKYVEQERDKLRAALEKIYSLTVVRLIGDSQIAIKIENLARAVLKEVRH